MGTVTHSEYESGRYTAATLHPRASSEGRAEVEAKGHSQTEGETILSELHSIPQMQQVNTFGFSEAPWLFPTPLR